MTGNRPAASINISSMDSAPSGLYSAVREPHETQASFTSHPVLNTQPEHSEKTYALGGGATN
jgi:hypothetical protein